VNHAVARGAVGAGRGGNDVRVTLTSSEDPARALAPGSELHLELAVEAEPRAGWGYGYLLVEDLAGTATITAAEHAEWFPEQRWFRVRSEAGDPAVGRFTLKVADRPKTPTLRPSIAVGRTSGPRMARTLALSDRVFRLGRAPVAGLRLTVPIGAACFVRLPDDTARVLDVRPPRSGVASATEDGRGLRYEARAGFTGYDRFTYTRRSADGTTATGAVTVFVGRLDEAPGLLTPPSDDGQGVTAIRPWQENEVVGEMPWPSVRRPARGTEEAR
jgi:hypothetical protein